MCGVRDGSVEGFEPVDSRRGGDRHDVEQIRGGRIKLGMVEDDGK